MIDSVGAHRGMHYYNFPLVDAMVADGADVIYISTDDTAKHSLRPKNVCTRAGFKGIYGRQPKWWRGIQYIISLLRIAFWIKEKKPDVAHFHFFQLPKVDRLFLLWVKKQGISVIVTVHDVLPFHLGDEHNSAKNEPHYQLFKCANGLIANSKYAMDLMLDIYPDLVEKTQLIYPGNYTAFSQQDLIDDNKAKKQLHLGVEDRIILIFGTIKPNKRLDWVINALPDILKKIPDAKLVIAGLPREQDVTPYIELAHNLNISERIFWDLNFISDDALRHYFSAADVVVFPYQWIYQSAAIPMAMSFGKPVVATAVGSNVEFIENDKTGLLVPLDDPAAMAQAILTVLSNPNRATAMGHEAARFVEVELSWDKIAQSTIEFYNRIIGQKESP